MVLMIRMIKQFVRRGAEARKAAQQGLDDGERSLVSVGTASSGEFVAVVSRAGGCNVVRV